jgi:predicted enzyme related to lactoylglutathione lyase
VGERTSHKPGTFSWTDLATTDQEGAKGFYQGLFGWDCEDTPVGDGVYYSMMRIGGRAVAAISTQPASMREQGIPPVWNSYVTVEDADAAAARANEVGGNVLAEPFDVLDAGRMAVLGDPQGAFFMVWQPRASIGAELVNAPGALTLNQLNTSDPEAARRFYSELFGWEIRELEGTGQPYWSIHNGETLNAGMMNLPPGAEAPPHWLVYFATEKLEDTLAQVGERGGEVVVSPTDVPAGRIAVARDPQGAYFALWEGELDP